MAKPQGRDSHSKVLAQSGSGENPSLQGRDSFDGADGRHHGREQTHPAISLPECNRSFVEWCSCLIRSAAFAIASGDNDRDAMREQYVEKVPIGLFAVILAIEQFVEAAFEIQLLDNAAPLRRRR